MSAEIADELRAKLRDEWLRKATSSFTCQGCGIQANFIDEIIDALDAKDKRIAELLAALRNVRGYMADVAVAGMLIGADQAETHTRVSAHGIAMLKIVDAALSSSLPNKEDRNG